MFKKFAVSIYCITLLAFSSNCQDIGLYHIEEFDLAHKSGVPGVYSMFQDTLGVIWLGSTNGIYRYDGSRIYEFNEAEKKVLGKTNFAFLQAKNGDVIIGSDYGICRYHIRTNKVELLIHLNRVFNDRSRYYPICFDPDDNLWFAASGRGLGRFKKAINWIENPPGIEPEMIAKLADAYYDSRTHTIYLSNLSGNLAATFNIDKERYTLDSYSPISSFSYQNGELYSITASKIQVENPQTGQRREYLFPSKKPVAINFLYSNALCIDQEWMWISLRDGILPFNYRKGVFGDAIGYEGDSKCPLLMHISFLFKDKQGTIWICTETNGIKRFNLPHNKRFQFLTDGNKPNNIIMQIEPVNDSLVLVFPLVDAPRLVNIYTNRHIQLFPKSAQKTTYKATTLGKTAIAIFNEAGTEYIYDKKNLILSAYSFPVKNIINIMPVKDADKVIILAPDMLLLCKYDGNRFQLLKKLQLPFSSESAFYNPFTNQVLYSNQVKCLIIDASSLSITGQQNAFFGSYLATMWDKNKTLWLATRSGLLHFDTSYKVIKTYNTANGLGNDVVYTIQPDNDTSILYLSTNMGISSIDINSKKIVNYTINNGLIESEHNGGANARDKNGNYYFGNIRGVTVFNDSFTSNNSYLPRILFHEISIDNVPYQDAANPNYISTIKMLPENHVLNISFGLLHTSEPGNLVYSYKIEGIDRVFQKSVTAPLIRVVDPAPGKYTIRIRGNVQGEKVVEKQIQLIVLSPFYLKWWFIVLVVLLLAFSVVFFTRRLINNRLKKKQAEIEKERSIYEQKSQIARELHDNVGARLSMMLNTVDWIEKKPQILHNDLLEIKENTRAVIQGLRDAIWVMDKMQITGEELFDKIKYYANQTAKYHQIQLIFSGSFHKPVTLNTTQALNFFRIVQESLNNALKYANASQFEISMNFTEKSEFRLLVADNGCGFEKQKAVGGHGLTNMQSRADEINAKLDISSSPDKGTAISVVLYIV